jgi:hypothetical protein
LANLSIEKDLVLLSHDDFTRKLDCPKVYLLFYDHYLRAVVGAEGFERNIRKSHPPIMGLDI